MEMDTLELLHRQTAASKLIGTTEEQNSGSGSASRGVPRYLTKGQDSDLVGVGDK